VPVAVGPAPIARAVPPEPHQRAAGSALPELVIAPAGSAPRFAFHELWAYRGLLYFLVWRDLKVRYTQTVLGVAWAVLQPLLNTVVFTLVFGRLVRIPTDGVPYPVFALAALVPWAYVSTAFATAGTSLLNNSNLITKVYFPRLVIPWAPVCAAGVDFGVGLVLLAAALIGYGQVPNSWALIAVPASIVMFALTAAGVGCWVAALSIQYRDVKHLLPFLSTVWMYASPVVYPMSRVPERYRLLYALNPLAGTVEAFRASLVGRPVLWGPWAESAVVAIALFVTGAVYFQRTERVFADIV
jgi:lipopolysaccharide transport system permease protein